MSHHRCWPTRGRPDCRPSRWWNLRAMTTARSTAGRCAKKVWVAAGRARGCCPGIAAWSWGPPAGQRSVEWRLFPAQTGRQGRSWPGAARTGVRWAAPPQAPARWAPVRIGPMQCRLPTGRPRHPEPCCRRCSWGCHKRRLCCRNRCRRTEKHTPALCSCRWVP